MDYEIIVTVGSNGVYNYTAGGVGARQHHVKNGDRIRWKADQGAITVNFNKNGDPTTPPSPHTAAKGKWTSWADLSGKLSHGPYDYTVTVQGYNPDDPQIIFDDGGEPPPELTDPAPTIKTVMSDLLDQLNSHAAADKFFPFGITNIQVSVTAGGITFSVTVSGPNTKP